MIKKILKNIYFLIPFKKNIFQILKLFYIPNPKKSFFLKFDDVFDLKVDNKIIKIRSNNNSIESLLFWHGLEEYEPTTIQIWKDLCKHSTCIFDIGANTGLFSLLAKTINENASVYGIEPLDRNMKRFLYNIRLNNIEIHTINQAISDYEGEATLFDMDSIDNTIASLYPEFVLEHKHHKKLQPIIVTVNTIDNIRKINMINTIHLIKIDVEGAEVEVMLGMKDTIYKNYPTLIIEISNETCADKLNIFFKEMPYYFYEIIEGIGIRRTKKIEKINERNYLICIPEIAGLLKTYEI